MKIYTILKIFCISVIISKNIFTFFTTRITIFVSVNNLNIIYLKEWSKLKYKKIILITSVVSIVIVAAVSFNLNGILMKLSGHSMKNSDPTSTSHSSHDLGDKNSILDKLVINKDLIARTSTNAIPNINTPPRKKEPVLTNVTFIDYVVNPADTLWRIAKYYMPSYAVQDSEDTLGVITYIAEKNNLSKGTDGSYMIYYGQKLIVPAQLSIVSNSMTTSNKNTVTANKTVITESTNKPSIPTSSNTPKSSSNSTPNNSTSSPVSQTDHSSHN